MASQPRCLSHFSEAASGGGDFAGKKEPLAEFAIAGQFRLAQRFTGVLRELPRAHLRIADNAGPRFGRDLRKRFGGGGVWLAEWDAEVSGDARSALERE